GDVDHTHWRDRPSAVRDETIVVLPLSRDDWVSCGPGCRRPRYCPRCSDEVRAEALSWLRDLADDQFGRTALDGRRSQSPDPEVTILARDPMGVVRYYENAQRPTDE